MIKLKMNIMMKIILILHDQNQNAYTDDDNVLDYSEYNNVKEKTVITIMIITLSELVP